MRLDWGEGYPSYVRGYTRIDIRHKTWSDLKYLLNSLYYLGESWAPYIHIILSYVVSITWYINQPLVRRLLQIINLSVSKISLAQVYTAQWSDTIPCQNVQFQVRIHLTQFCFNIDDCTNQCHSEWAPLSHVCVQHQTFIHQCQFSVLSALSDHGIVALDIFEGSMMKEWFISFLKEQSVRKNITIIILSNCHIWLLTRPLFWLLGLAHEVVLHWLGLTCFSNVQITWDSLLQRLRSEIWPLSLWGHGYTQIISRIYKIYCNH